MPKSNEIFTDVLTASTLQPDGDICCPNCGSWTHIDDVKQDPVTGESSCLLCRPKEVSHA